MALRVTIVVSAIALHSIALAAHEAQDFGTFVGSFSGTFLEEGWRFRLSEDLAYLDPDGKRWMAPR